MDNSNNETRLKSHRVMLGMWCPWFCMSPILSSSAYYLYWFIFSNYNSGSRWIDTWVLAAMRWWHNKLAWLNQTQDQIYWDITWKGSDSIGINWKRTCVICSMSHIHVITCPGLRECKKIWKLRKYTVSEIVGSSLTHNIAFWCYQIQQTVVL